MQKYNIWKKQRINNFNGKAFIKTMAVQTHPYYKCKPENQADGLV